MMGGMGDGERVGWRGRGQSGEEGIGSVLGKGVFVKEIAERGERRDAGDRGDGVEEREDVRTGCGVDLQTGPEDGEQRLGVGAVGGHGVVEVEDGQAVVLEGGQEEGQAEEQHAERPHVRLVVDGLAAVQVAHLGGAVGERGVALQLLVAALDLRGGARRHHAAGRAAKVAQQHRSVVAQQQVLRLQVSVHDGGRLSVQVRHRLARGLEDAPHFSFFHPILSSLIQSINN